MIIHLIIPWNDNYQVFVWMLVGLHYRFVIIETWSGKYLIKRAFLQLILGFLCKCESLHDFTVCAWCVSLRLIRAHYYYGRCNLFCNFIHISEVEMLILNVVCINILMIFSDFWPFFFTYVEWYKIWQRCWHLLLTEKNPQIWFKRLNGPPPGQKWLHRKQIENVFNLETYGTVPKLILSS